MNQVYITKMARFLPNSPVSSDEMEDYLGFVKGRKSRVKPMILRSNGIKTRHYALDKMGNITHTNAQISEQAIRLIEKQGFDLSELELLAIGTTSSDQLLPSHASMVQGLLANRPMEVVSPEGSCNSGMLALKYAAMAIQTASCQNAIAGGSEFLSIWLRSLQFEEEAEQLIKLQKEPYVQFDREFLRWMLSDGAAMALLQSKPNADSISLRIDFVDIISFSNELPPCMYAGAERSENGDLKPWRSFSQSELIEKSIMSIQQDTRLLGRTIVEYGVQGIRRICDKYNFTTDQIDYFLPHMSSEFFRNKIEVEAAKVDCPLPQDKWFTNLTKFGNVGAASAFLMMEEILNSGKLKKGETLLVMSPESARFSYAYVKLTVV